MLVKVRLINDKGRPLSTADSQARPTYAGVLRIGEDRSTALARAFTKAQLLSPLDSVPTDVLPPLADAQVLALKGQELRVRGFETRDGIQYGQTWVCEVQPCSK